MIYIIEHTDPRFTGFFGGVDSHAGKGSTNSIANAPGLARAFGFRVLAEDSDVPLDLSQTPDEAKAAAARAEERPVIKKHES